MRISISDWVEMIYGNDGSVSSQNLISNLIDILNIVEERDILMAGNMWPVDEANFGLFNSLNDNMGPKSYYIIVAQLAIHSPALEPWLRANVRKLLQERQQELSFPTRLLISELVGKAPSSKVSKRTTLARDVFIAFALRILIELGHGPTRRFDERQSGKNISGCELVFMYLNHVRGLEFPDQLTTLSKIWEKRLSRIRQIGIDFDPYE